MPDLLVVGGRPVVVADHHRWQARPRLVLAVVILVSVRVVARRVSARVVVAAAQRTRVGRPEPAIEESR